MALYPERQRRVTKERRGKKVTRQSYQQGHISGPHDTRGGKAFRIRYRVRTSAGKWKQRSEMLYGLSGKKEARSVLDIRIRESSTATSELSELTLRSFVEGYWKPYLDRKSLKPSTRKNYDSVLENHILPALGDHRSTYICPMHIVQLLQAKS